MNPSTLRRWLLLSAIANLFLVAAIGGGAWRWWHGERAATAAAAAQARGLRYAADDLAPERRQAYRAALRAARREATGSIQAAREGRQDVMNQFAAPQFDRAAAAAALARTREADTASRTRLETSVLDFAATLSPAERRQLAEGLARRSMLAPPGERRVKTPAAVDGNAAPSR